jgi:hypothetical protein
VLLGRIHAAGPFEVRIYNSLPHQIPSPRDGARASHF